MADESIFDRIIKEDRAVPDPTRWRGTFLEYLEKVRVDAFITKLAHARIYDLIVSFGVRNIQDSDDPRTKRLYKNEPVKVFNFFADEFFGIERTISQIVQYFHSGSFRSEESRQVLYLMGPVGSGKSSLVERIQRGLEQLEPIYAIDGCPMYEEPLHLIPRHLRRQFEKMLGVHIEGDLCPVCRYRLNEEFGKRYEEFPVSTRNFSKRNRVGIGVVPPVDPNNQDTSVLIGSEDISKLDIYSEGDPRVLELNGALNVGNRGLVEFIEVFKNQTEFLHAMITATQEKTIPVPGRNGMVYVDTCIVAHSNEAEWRKFRADDTNEAILDRMVVVKVPYNLRLSEEVKIYQKIIRNSDFRAHVAPHTIELASMFAILSRLEPTPKCDLMTKLKLYNGEVVIEHGRTKDIDVADLRENTKREGMSGISTRFIMKALDHTLSDHVLGNCIDPIAVRDKLISMTKEAYLADNVRKLYLDFLQNILHKEYLEILEKEITSALVYSYHGEEAEELFRKSLQEIRAYANQGKACGPTTQEGHASDGGFLRSIEEQIGIVGSAAESFRQQVIEDFALRQGKEIRYGDFAVYYYGGNQSRGLWQLKWAIEKKLISAARDVPRVIIEALARDEELRDKHDPLVTSLLDNGYCESCADVVLRFAATNLWRDCNQGGGFEHRSSRSSFQPPTMISQGSAQLADTSPRHRRQARRKRGKKVPRRRKE